MGCKKTALEKEQGLVILAGHCSFLTESAVKCAVLEISRGFEGCFASVVSVKRAQKGSLLGIAGLR